MRHTLSNLAVLGIMLTTMAATAAADSKDDAIKKDRERIEGTWRVVALVVDGNKSNDEDVRKITVVNGADGTWSLRSDDNEISRGTSTIDPTEKPKTIEFTPTKGEGTGEQHLGIYRLGKDTRNLCFAPPGTKRPTKFDSKAGSGHIFVTFERVE